MNTRSAIGSSGLVVIVVALALVVGVGVAVALGGSDGPDVADPDTSDGAPALAAADVADNLPEDEDQSEADDGAGDVAEDGDECAGLSADERAQLAEEFEAFGERIGSMLDEFGFEGFGFGFFEDEHLGSGDWGNWFETLCDYGGLPHMIPESLLDGEPFDFDFELPEGLFDGESFEIPEGLFDGDGFSFDFELPEGLLEGEGFDFDFELPEGLFDGEDFDFDFELPEGLLEGGSFGELDIPEWLLERWDGLLEAYPS